MAGWLRERDAAPITMLSDFITGGIHTMMPAKKLLDEGGPEAEQAILALKVSSEAVLLDRNLQDKMQSLVQQYREAKRRLMEQSDGQGELAALAKSYGDRASLYQQLIDNLGESPPEPPMTQEERDATSLLGFRMMKADLGLRKQVGLDSEGSTPRRAGILAACNPGRTPKKSSADQQQLQMQRQQRIEELLLQLFKLHDLKADGVLEEGELVKLNEKVAMLHYGKDTDKSAVRAKYKELFRQKFDPDGHPAPFCVFRNYMIEVLNDIDTDPRAQEMMLEQFCAEAESAREAFQFQSFQSASDAPFMPRGSRDFHRSSSLKDSQRSDAKDSTRLGGGFVPPTASIRGPVVEPTALPSVAEDGVIDSTTPRNDARSSKEPMWNSRQQQVSLSSKSAVAGRGSNSSDPRRSRGMPPGPARV
mmetsp:Transcript_9009/g.16279  ORF Transcript_9009/g.16279 Transcript_9009/m.16279 type:complete len:419 (+) Transcript_9009:105-1361(+)